MASTVRGRAAVAVKGQYFLSHTHTKKLRSSNMPICDTGRNCKWDPFWSDVTWEEEPRH